MNKRAGHRSELRATHIAVAVAAAFAPWSLHGQTPPPPNTLPHGGVITHGSGAISAPVHTPALSTLDIDQTSARMAARFGSFSIGERAHVKVTQPSSSSIALFNDVSGRVSQIYGGLSANGQIFISNQNGVLIGRTGHVEAAGFVASTLSLNESEFMLGGNSFNWIKGRETGKVANEGTIITPGGYAMLAGPQVLNDGLIIANRGSVALAAGDRVSLDLIGDGLISVSVDQAALNASVINTGTLQADGGTVMLKASGANALLDTVINTSGIVRANSLVAVNGQIILDGGGAVQVAGTVEAAGGAINVSADSSLNVGSTVCCVPTQVTAGTQTIEAASITVGGGASVTTTSGSQTVTTPGTLLVRGGVLSGGVGLFHNGSGEQRISAGNLELRGGTGTNTGAFINSNAGGDQVVTVTGALTITGGASGTGNRAGLVSTGAQTINGNPDIVLTGGSGGGSGNASNNVFIQATGPDTKPQTINARSIRVNAGTGTDASATLNAARQVINTIGDVSVFGSGGLGGGNGARIGGIGGTTLGPTNLTLNVGGDLLVHGGSANGASLGSSGASTQANTITVNAAGNITLESEGAGARIGSSNQAGATPGNISVTAGESLELGSGTAVRANGPITLTANRLTNAGTITNGGGAANQNMIFLADAFNLAGGTITAGNAGVFLRPRTGTNSFGIEAAGATTLTNADIASIITGNFVVFGSGTGTNFTGNVVFGENARVNGGTKNLAFIRSLSPGGTVTVGAHGLATTGDVIVSAGGGSIASNGGTVAGDEMQLRATQGIGTSGARVHTDANALTLGTAGGAFVSEANGVTLRNIVLNVGGNTALNTTTTGTGTLDLNVAGTLNVAAAGTLDATVTSSAGQTITAQSLNISAQDGRTARILNSGSAGQSITAGNIDIQTAVGGGVAEIRNNAASSQNLTVTGEGLTVRGMGGGAANIASSGDQAINMTASGPKSITIGDHAAQGLSTISSNGDQKVLGYADITITGGSGPVANGSNATIFASNPTRTQRIEARNLSLANSILGGNNSFAGIQGAHQSIHALGNVTLTANASGGTLPGVRIGGLSGPGSTATDLNLTVGGDLILTGGSAVNNGVGIGTTAAPPAGAVLANNITIDAGGNVILTSGTADGTGARIGSSGTAATMPGDIRITAGGTIALNGTAQPTAIRTLGNVELQAASISEASNGFIVADTLTTTTTAATNLAGPNEIARLTATSGDPLTLVDAGTLQVTGISTTNDAITLTTDSLTNSGVISNGSSSSAANVILNADAFNLAGGTIEGGAAAVVLRPRTGSNSFGIEAAGATTVSNADIANIQTDNFIIFGSSTGTVFTGNMTVGENARVEGNGKNLAFSRSLAPGAEMIIIGSQGVATTGDIIIGAGGGGIRSNGGTVTGDDVVLRASNGIGMPSARVKTAANALALNNAGGGGVFVSELDNVTLRTISLNAGGPFTVSNTNSGSFSLISGGDVSVAGLVSSGGSMILDAGGNLKLDAASVDAELRSVGGQTISAQSINLTAQNGRRATIDNFNGSQKVTATTGGIALHVATGVGSAQITNRATFQPGDQTVEAAGELIVLGGGNVGTGNSGLFKDGLGMQTVRAAGITLQAASIGTNAGAGIRSQGDQLIDVSGDINLRGGNGGTNNGAFLQANPTTGLAGEQTIYARNINMSNGVGGFDSSATITAGIQRINASGNVTLTSQGALLGPTPGGPGVRIGAPGGRNYGTDLKLTAGGNIVLNGGTVAENGAALGSSGTGTPAPNKIDIVAGGSVILNAGDAPNTGVRIGSGSAGTAGGDITILAGGNIELNGTQRSAAIRTLDKVTLNATHITEVGAGTIIAGTLSTHSSGRTLLTGMDAGFNITNAVSNFNGVSGGDLKFFNRGPLTVTGVNAGGDALVVNALADLTLTGQWTSSTANIFSGAAIVESGAGAIQAASLTVEAPLGLNLAGANRVGMLDGKTSGVLTFNNVTALEVARASASNGANLTSAGTMTISGPVTSSSSINLTANGGSIVETDTGSITTGAFGSLSTFSSGDTRLESFNNQVSRFNATSGGDIGLRTNGFLTLTTINAPGTTEISAGDLSLSSTVTSPHVLLNAGGSISQFGAASGIIADALATTSGGNTTLGGENRVASYSGTSGADLFFFNRGALNVTHLDAVNANLSNEGTIIISGPWSTSASTTIGASGFEGSLVEAAGGFIQSSGHTDLFAQQSIDLNGPNQITGYLSLFGMQGDVSATNTGDLTTFAGTATFGDLTFVNTGSLNLSGLSALNASVTNHGPMTISGSWFSRGASSIATEGAGSQLTVTSSVFSNGPMTVDVDGTLTVTASGVQTLPPPPGLPPFPPMPSFATLTSSGGQDITAQSIHVGASDGAQAFINNQGAGNQNITVTGGGIEIHSAGGPVPPGTIGSFAQIGNSTAGDQTITVSGGGVQLRSAGGSAQISTGLQSAPNIPPSTGAQAITVMGGPGINIEAQGGGNASINQTGAGAQRLFVTHADHINVNGSSGNAIVFANGGTQEISIAGSGANAITVGSAGASGLSQLVGGSQDVSAGTVTIIGSDAAARTNGFITFNNPAAPGRTQSIETTGAITVVGGNAPFQFIPPPPQPQVPTSSNAGFFHNSNGAQTVTAGGITLQGGTGINDGVFINSTAGGDQTVSVAGGSIAITGGAAGTGNRAGFVTNANQTINGNPDILLAGGAGGIANNAFIQATGSNSLQAIHARNVRLHAGAGIDASSTLNAARQVISTSGDVSLVGSGGAGTLNGVRIGGVGATLGSTNLTLDVGGNLLLQGGTASGVSLGSSAASTQSNNITVRAAGNVSLESEGAGARIGTSGQVPVSSGEIVITAGGNMHLGNGTAIRTSDNVGLHADQPGGTISQGTNGLIRANALVTSSHGSTSLVGSNQIASFTASSRQGDVHLTNSKPVLTLGSMDLPGNLTVVQTGGLAVGSATAERPTLVSAAGNISMSASGEILVRGSDTTPESFAQIIGHGPMDISAAGNVRLVGGSADGAFARILGYSDINLTVGGFITLDAGSGVDSWARIQTASPNSVITLNFPSLVSGGYFVNGMELLSDGPTGFLSGNGVIAPAQVITIYGAP